VRVRTSEKIIILDRDGTIVIDRGYLDNDAGLEFAPGAAAGLALPLRAVERTNAGSVAADLLPAALTVATD
jgi:hypothetical protein